MVKCYALVITMSLSVTLALSRPSPGWWRCGSCYWTGIRRPSDVVAVESIFIGKVRVVATWEVLRRLVYLGRCSGRRGSSCRCNFGLSS